MQERFFRVEGFDIWGDYGNILVHGMSCHLGRDHGLIRLERTGPFVPPISFPGGGHIVVTRSFQERMQQSGQGDFRFQPLIKQRIVHLDWQEWDLGADEPLEFPEGGEPEDYILARPHSRRTAQEMSPLSELVIEKQVEIDRVNGIRIVAKTWNGEDFFRANGVLHNFVTRRGKDWLEREAGKWVRFIPQPSV